MIRHLQERASSPGSSIASCTDKAESISIYRCKTYYTTFLRNVPMPVGTGLKNFAFIPHYLARLHRLSDPIRSDTPKWRKNPPSSFQSAFVDTSHPESPGSF